MPSQFERLRRMDHLTAFNLPLLELRILLFLNVLGISSVAVGPILKVCDSDVSEIVMY